MKKVAVIFGGTSVEYEVSLKSAYAVLEALKNLPYEIVTIGITKNGQWLLYEGVTSAIKEDTWVSEGNCTPLTLDFNRQSIVASHNNKSLEIDIVFPMLHGGDGENGVIQGVFDMLNLPYVGCGVTSSAVSMNKLLLHKFAEALDIKSTPTAIIFIEDDYEATLTSFIAENEFPFFVKPNESGSSKGITKVEKQEDLELAIREAALFDKKVLIQKAVSGVEIGCSILGNEELLVGECDQVNLSHGFFDFFEKYHLETATIEVPAPISKDQRHYIQKQAKKLYEALDCSGLARVDFFISDTGDIFFNEINTMPGFTAHSRLPMMMKEIGLSYEEIVDRLIILGGKRHENKLPKIG